MTEEASFLKAPNFLYPKESGKFIVENANHVKVHDAGIAKIGEMVFQDVISGTLSPQRFKQTELHPKEANEKAIDWIFLVDTLNFSFWSGVNVIDREKVREEGTHGQFWEVEFNGKVYTGYFALCAGINRAILEGIDITNPTIFGAVSKDVLLSIFRTPEGSSAQIPMIDQRMSNLVEAATVLRTKYNGSFVNVVKAADQSAKKLLELIVTDFHSYRDQNEWNGKIVSFWKRAQILIGDIWACFEGQRLGYFKDIDELAMFPDYRIPQVLLHFGALSYTPQLFAILEKDELLLNGSEYEIEIRGASIHAVELINSYVQAKLKELSSIANPAPIPIINSIMIDHFLWDYRREHAEELDKFPYHKVRCIFY